MTETGNTAVVDEALLDAELFLKYRLPRKAVERLLEAIQRQPHSVRLRESLRDIAAANEQKEEAARQCLELVRIYLAREDFDTAQERLLEARQLDPRISIARGLEAIRRARRPDLAPASQPAPRAPRSVTFAGDLSVVSIFDAVQVIENARLTGALHVTGGVGGEGDDSRILFNEGRIVGAESGGHVSNMGLRRVLEKTDGEFDFERAPQPFPVTIQAHSNTNLLLDTLRELDEEKAEGS